MDHKKSISGPCWLHLAHPPWIGDGRPNGPRKRRPLVSACYMLSLALRRIASGGRPRLPGCLPVTQRSRGRRRARVNVLAVWREARRRGVSRASVGTRLQSSKGTACAWHAGACGLAHAYVIGAVPDALPLAGGAVMIASKRPSRRWQVLLNLGGESISARQGEFKPEGQSTFCPMVSRERYEADRQQSRSTAFSDPGSKKPMLRSFRLVR